MSHLLVLSGGIRARLSRKLHVRLDRDYPGTVTHIQESNNGLFPVRTIVERPVVHVHADEAVGHLRIEVTSELHRIGERLFTMVQCVLNAVAKRLRNTRNQLAPETTADCVSSEGQGKARHLLPPPSKIDNSIQ